MGQRYGPFFWNFYIPCTKARSITHANKEEESKETFDSRDFRWVPGVGPYILYKDLKYGPLVCLYLIMLLSQVDQDSESGVKAGAPDPSSPVTNRMGYRFWVPVYRLH